MSVKQISVKRGSTGSINSPPPPPFSDTCLTRTLFMVTQQRITPEPLSPTLTLCRSVFTPWIIFRMGFPGITLHSLTRPHPASIFRPIKNLVSLVSLITHSFQNGERNGVFSDSQSELSNISDELSSLESSHTEIESEESDNGATDLTGDSSQTGSRKRKIFPSQRSTCDGRREKECDIY